MDGDRCILKTEEATIDDLIPSTPDDTDPTIIDIDPNTLEDNYEIGFGFFYRYLFRMPKRVEINVARENWLGIAGITEKGDYGNF